MIHPSRRSTSFEGTYLAIYGPQRNLAMVAQPVSIVCEMPSPVCFSYYDPSADGKEGVFCLALGQSDECLISQLDLLVNKRQELQVSDSFPVSMPTQTHIPEQLPSHISHPPSCNFQGKYNLSNSTNPGHSTDTTTRCSSRPASTSSPPSSPAPGASTGSSATRPRTRRSSPSPSTSRSTRQEQLRYHPTQATSPNPHTRPSPCCC